MKPRNKQIATTGGTGYIPPVINPSKIINGNEIRKRLYDNISPYGYEDAVSRVFNAVVLNRREGTDGNQVYLPQVDDLWATYLLIPRNQRHPESAMDENLTRIIPAIYKPTRGKTSYPLYRLNLDNYSKLALVDEAMGNTTQDGLKVSPNPYNNTIGITLTKKKPLNIGENRTTWSNDRVLNKALREFTVGRGRDNKGEYVSYYDLWDLSPYRFSNKDQSFGIGNPFELYDRIYLDDYYGVPSEYRGGSYLPEVVIKPRRKQ